MMRALCLCVIALCIGVAVCDPPKFPETFQFVGTGFRNNSKGLVNVTATIGVISTPHAKQGIVFIDSVYGKFNIQYVLASDGNSYEIHHNLKHCARARGNFIGIVDYGISLAGLEGSKSIGNVTFQGKPAVGYQRGSMTYFFTPDEQQWIGIRHSSKDSTSEASISDFKPTLEGLNDTLPSYCDNLPFKSNEYQYEADYQSDINGQVEERQVIKVHASYRMNEDDVDWKVFQPNGQLDRHQYSADRGGMQYTFIVNGAGNCRCSCVEGILPVATYVDDLMFDVGTTQYVGETTYLDQPAVLYEDVTSYDGSNVTDKMSFYFQVDKPIPLGYVTTHHTTYQNETESAIFHSFSLNNDGFVFGIPDACGGVECRNHIVGKECPSFPG